MNDMNDIIEIIDPQSEHDGKIGKIIQELDKCGYLVIQLFGDNKIIFVNEKQLRLLCEDEILNIIVEKRNEDI